MDSGFKAARDSIRLQFIVRQIALPKRSRVNRSVRLRQLSIFEAALVRVPIVRSAAAAASFQNIDCEIGPAGLY